MVKEIPSTAPEVSQTILPIVFDPNGLDRTFLTPEQRQLLEYIEQDPETFIRERLAGYEQTGVEKPIEWFLFHYNHHSFNKNVIFHLRSQRL